MHEQLCESSFKVPSGVGDESAHGTSWAVSLAGCDDSEKLLISASFGASLGTGDGDMLVGSGGGNGDGELGFGEGDVTGSGEGLC
jgi:hypothetical protein